MIASSLLLLVACGEDSPTSTNVAQNNAQPATGVPDVTVQQSETIQPKGPMTLPPTPIRRYEGQRNPFSPLITLVKEQEIIVASAQAVKRDPQTSLEKIGLDQLSLTAIFKGAKGNKAIVEEKGGKGHIVDKGAYIGTRGGRIQSITPDRIVIVEKTVDSNGKVFTQKKELKLASPSNDPS